MYLQTLISNVEGLYQWVRLPPVRPEDSILYYSERIRIASNNVVEVTVKGPSINHSFRAPNPYHCMDDHGIVQVQKEGQLLIFWKGQYVNALQILNQIHISAKRAKISVKRLKQWPSLFLGDQRYGLMIKTKLKKLPHQEMNSSKWIHNLASSM